MTEPGPANGGAGQVPVDRVELERDHLASTVVLQGGGDVQRGPAALRRELEDELGRGVADHEVEEAALLAGVRLAEGGDQRIEPAEARDAVGEPSIEAGRQIGRPRSGRRASGQVAGRRGHRASVLHEATSASMAAWMPRRR